MCKKRLRKRGRGCNYDFEGIYRFRCRISSLISSTGAAYLLLHLEDIDLFISNISLQELERVGDRLHLEKTRLENLVKQRLQLTVLAESVAELKDAYREYVLDIDDAHIVAGAKEAQVTFLVSYNTKHFKADKLKQDFNIILTTPAIMLQYLRSL